MEFWIDNTDALNLTRDIDDNRKEAAVLSSNNISYALLPTDRTEIPHIVSYIWVGENKISQKNLSNILHCANMNQDSRVNIYFDNSRRCDENALRQTSGFDIKLPTTSNISM